jgi:hypothetical protein
MEVGGCSFVTVYRRVENVTRNFEKDLYPTHSPRKKPKKKEI